MTSERGPLWALAGGTAAADAVEFSLAADLGGNDYTIGENQYLAKRASSLSYRATITANADGTWSYDEVTMQDERAPRTLRARRPKHRAPRGLNDMHRDARPQTHAGTQAEPTRTGRHREADSSTATSSRISP